MRTLLRRPKTPFNVRYRIDPENEDTWLSLDEILKEIQGGKWSHNQFFEQVDVAIEAGYTPSDFWELDDFDKALIMARFRAKALIDSYESHLREKESKRKK